MAEARKQCKRPWQAARVRELSLSCEAAGPQLIYDSRGRRVPNDPYGFNLQSATLAGGYRDIMLNAMLDGHRQFR